MESQKVWDVNLNGDTFNSFKNDFNIILRKTLMNMEDKSSQYAEVTVKMKISLSEDQVPDATVVGYDAKRDVIVPKFEHTVSSVLQIKDKKGGALSGRYELIWDRERGEYVMREIKENQMNLFDVENDFDYPENGDGIVDAEFKESTKTIDRRKVALLESKEPEGEEDSEDE